MKIKILSILLLVVISIGCFLTSNHVSQDLSMNELFSVNIAQAEDPCVDDESEITMCADCEDGSSCECTACMKGTTDCSPTCPCCPEDI